MLFLGAGGFRPPMDTTLRSMRRLGVDLELLTGKLQMLRVVADRCALQHMLASQLWMLKSLLVSKVSV
jgi:hypothetical protein